MTGEEKQKAINALKISAPIMAVTQEEFNDYIHTLNKIMDWLEQEPILDKIRAEIEAIIGEHNWDDYDFCSGLICARKIIDKYKAESENAKRNTNEA